MNILNEILMNWKNYFRNIDRKEIKNDNSEIYECKESRNFYNK